MIDGICDSRFVGVRAALEENFEHRGEVGAGLAVVLGGRTVVDLWGGWADAARTRRWQSDTLVNVFSAGKGLAAVLVLRLVERGLLVPDLPVTRYWPAFASHGKGDVTVRELLGHRAGLPGIRRPLPPGAMYDHDAMAAALADEPPWWEPGRQHGYHVNTFGFLVAELVRRVCNERFGKVFREQVAGPLGADAWFGLPAAMDARVADHLLPDDDGALAELLLSAEEIVDAEARSARRRDLEAIYVNPPGLSGFGTVNTRAWRGAEMPSANAHATARGLAAIYAALLPEAGAGRLLRDDTLAMGTAEVSAGLDVVLRRPARYGLGFQLSRGAVPFGHGARCFGHGGTGGTTAFVDPDRQLAFAYVLNQPGPRFLNPCTRAVIDATYAAL